jgi:5'-methylthioadenosine phosphorylase
MRLGVIGGTGLVDMDLSEQLDDGVHLIRDDRMTVETSFGSVPLRAFTLECDGVAHELFFLQRHHRNGGHSCPPHAINHRANLMAMHGAAVDAVVSVCSVGAIARDFPPGKVALADQYIDFTGVPSTFHDDEARFTSVTVPFDEVLNRTLQSILVKVQNFGQEECMQYTYWLTQGPQFETIAEVNAIERLGGDMVGMTMPREAKLANELDLPYAALCISSNWAAGREPGDASKDLDHLEVSAQANERLQPVWACILGLLS